MGASVREKRARERTRTRTGTRVWARDIEEDRWGGGIVGHVGAKSKDQHHQQAPKHNKNNIMNAAKIDNVKQIYF